jgi:hypothetical protein
MSSSSDGEADESWFEAWVPHYISAGETFHVIVNDKGGRFSMQIPCPIGAGAVTTRQALLGVIPQAILKLPNPCWTSPLPRAMKK